MKNKEITKVHSNEDKSSDNAKVRLCAGTKLISMIDYIFKLENTLGREESVGFRGFTKKAIDYAKFLSQPLTLGMFMPCDEDGNVLTEPEGYEGYQDSVLYRWNDSRYNDFFDDEEDFKEWKYSCQMYLQSECLVMFEGYETTSNNQEYKRILLKDIMFLTFYVEGNISLQAPYESSIIISTIEDLVKYDLYVKLGACT